MKIKVIAAFFSLILMVSVSQAAVRCENLFKIQFKIDPTATNHYEVLGLPFNASLADIHLAHKQGASRYHPDRMGRLSADDMKEASKNLASINFAHDVLSDPNKRKDYDEKNFGHSFHQPAASKPSSKNSGAAPAWAQAPARPNPAMDALNPFFTGFRQMTGGLMMAGTQALQAHSERTFEVMNKINQGQIDYLSRVMDRQEADLRDRIEQAPAWTQAALLAAQALVTEKLKDPESAVLDRIARNFEEKPEVVTHFFMHEVLEFTQNRKGPDWKWSSPAALVRDCLRRLSSTPEGLRVLLEFKSELLQKNYGSDQNAKWVTEDLEFTIETEVYQAQKSHPDWLPQLESSPNITAEQVQSYAEGRFIFEKMQAEELAKSQR